MEEEESLLALVDREYRKHDKPEKKTSFLNSLLQRTSGVVIPALVTTILATVAAGFYSHNTKDTIKNILTLGLHSYAVEQEFANRQIALAASKLYQDALNDQRITSAMENNIIPSAFERYGLSLDILTECDPEHPLTISLGEFRRFMANRKVDYESFLNNREVCRKPKKGNGNHWTTLGLLGIDDAYTDLGKVLVKIITKPPIVLEEPVRDRLAFIASHYGRRKNPWGGEKGEFHCGTDIAALRGTEIYAPEYGVVARVYYDRSGGRTIKIDHGLDKSGDRITTIIRHCGKVLVTKGSVVYQGDVIATVGTSGKVTGPHVHYEIHVNGKHVNPRRYLIDPTKAEEKRKRICAIRGDELSGLWSDVSAELLKLLAPQQPKQYALPD